MTKTPAAIIRWHSLDESGAPASIPAGCFSRQLETILEYRLRVVPLADVATSPGAVALTFDGGLRNFAEIALPQLQRHRLPATLFVASAHCSAGGRYLRWQELRELAAHGIEIGAQGVTLCDWTTQGSCQVAAEMDLSASVIAAETGQTARSIAYPFGRFDARVRWLASRRFQIGVGGSARHIQGSEDRHSLPRIDAHHLRQLFWLAQLQQEPGIAWVSARRIWQNLCQRL